LNATSRHANFRICGKRRGASIYSPDTGGFAKKRNGCLPEMAHPHPRSKKDAINMLSKIVKIYQGKD
jgi:hypothetical protein